MLTNIEIYSQNVDHKSSPIEDEGEEAGQSTPPLF